VQIDTSAFSPQLGYSRLHLARLTTDRFEKRDGVGGILFGKKKDKDNTPKNYPKQLSGLRAALKKNAELCELALADQLIAGDSPTAEHLRCASKTPHMNKKMPCLNISAV
jgi:hypothetical protein